MDRDYGPMGLRKNVSYNEVLRAIGQQPLDLPVPTRVGLKAYEDIFFSNLINDQSSYVGDVKKQGFRMRRPMSHHQDQRFITTLGQTQEQSLLMYPTAEEEEEEAEGAGVRLHHLLAI